jgi:transposase
VARLAERNGLWQRQHVLAAICRLDASFRVVEAPSDALDDAGQGGRNQSGTCRGGQRQRASRFWGAHTGPNPTDRAKKGCKRHVLTDAEGLPLVVKTTPANLHDSRMMLNLLVSMPAIAGPRGRPRIKPKVLQGDAAYGCATLAALVKGLGVRPLLKPLGKHQPHGSGLGKTRYVVERTLSWFGNFRRLKLCYERCGAHFQAFHELAAAILCARRLKPKHSRF